MGSGASKKSNAEDKSNFEEDDEEDFDTFSKKKAGNKPKLEQNGLLPKLEASPAKKAKGRNSIVGLEDEDDDFQPLRKPKKKDEEKELRNEIIELEKTFENLDLDSSIKKPKPMMTRGLYRSSTIDDSFSTRPARGSRPPLGPFGTPAPKPLKFSWEESKPAPVVDKDNDDWNYKQVRF